MDKRRCRFPDNEKKKLLYLLIKNHPRRQKLTDCSFCVDRIIEGESCIIQATINKNPNTGEDDFHLVINGDGYNEYDTDKFKELLIYF